MTKAYLIRTFFRHFESWAVRGLKPTMSQFHGARRGEGEGRGCTVGGWCCMRLGYKRKRFLKRCYQAYAVRYFFMMNFSIYWGYQNFLKNSAS